MGICVGKEKKNVAVERERERERRILKEDVRAGERTNEEAHDSIPSALRSSVGGVKSFLFFIRRESAEEEEEEEDDNDWDQDCD